MIRWTSAGAICLLIAACSSGTPTPPAPPDVIPPSSTATAAAPPTPLPGPAAALPTPLPGPAAALATPFPGAAVPRPTPRPDTTEWVKERLDAVVALYRPTEAGEALLRSLDLRQIEGDPGFFGSFGFNDWAGVGEANPIGVIHELGHSYWGGFPVAGKPGLSWDIPAGEVLSPAMESYHRDIVAFMGQPPDNYELLRQRLRNLPEVSIENPEPVFHSLEADMAYTTGGDLRLVPPILRKYWVNFFSAGPFGSWYDAAGWFQSLSQEDRAATDKWLGFEHLDLRNHHSLESTVAAEEVLRTAEMVLETEEKQRLRDLVDQFDLLIGDPQKEEEFQFWRRYLRDKVTLRAAHPGYLSSLESERAGQLASALGFLAYPASGSSAEQAERLADRLAQEPFLVNFLPAMDNQVLLDLFASGAVLPQGRTLQATASFVERLKVFGAAVDSIIRDSQFHPILGAVNLQKFLDETDFGQEEDLKLFFDLFRDRDPEMAKAVIIRLANDTVRELMSSVPFQLRTILNPEELIFKLGITSGAPSPAQLQEGITLLIEEPSGNYRVDEPYLEALFRVVANRVNDTPEETARLLLELPFPLEGMILAQPDAAMLMLSSDNETALALVRESDPLLAPPWRIMYRLLQAEPELAAELLAEFHRRGETVLVVETLSYFAYDKDRLGKSARFPISLENNGRFLSSLFRLEGEEWLQDRLAESVGIYRNRVMAGDVGSDFLERYRETMDAAVATLDSRGTRTVLEEIIRRAFDRY